MAPIIEVVIEEENIKKFVKLQNSSSEDKLIYGKLCDAIDKLKANPYRGRNIHKKLIPAKYKTYKNLWRDKLTDDWRLLYSVKNLGYNTIAVIIVDWMPHKEYNRIFGYD